MASVQRSTYIECPIDDVYDIALVDVEGLADWMVSVKSVDKVDDNWPDVGSSHVYTGLLMGRPYTGRTIITSADPPRSVDMHEETYIGEMKGQPAAQGDSRWTFEQRGMGTIATIQLLGGRVNPLSWLIWKLYGRRQTEGRLDRTLANLKRICEEEMLEETLSSES